MGDVVTEASDGARVSRDFSCDVDFGGHCLVRDPTFMSTRSQAIRELDMLHDLRRIR